MAFLPGLFYSFPYQIHLQFVFKHISAGRSRLADKLILNFVQSVCFHFLLSSTFFLSSKYCVRICLAFRISLSGTLLRFFTKPCVAITNVSVIAVLSQNASSRYCRPW